MGTWLPRLLTGALAIALTVAASAASASAVDNPSTSETVVVEVTVWRSVSNPDALYLSTRVEGGGWRTEDTALDMSERSRSGSFHQSNEIRLEVALEGGATAGVEVTVWRSVSNPERLYVSTRAEGGSWRTENTVLDMSALSRSRNFHQSNAVRVEVEVGNLIPEFPAPGTLTRIPSLNATVVDLRLYERPTGSFHSEERIYATTFDQLTTRLIGWELKLVHPPRSSRVDFEIETHPSIDRTEAYWRNSQQPATSSPTGRTASAAMAGATQRQRTGSREPTTPC